MPENTNGHDRSIVARRRARPVRTAIARTRRWPDPARRHRRRGSRPTPALRRAGTPPFHLACVARCHSSEFTTPSRLTTLTVREVPDHPGVPGREHGIVGQVGRDPLARVTIGHLDRTQVGIGEHLRLQHRGHERTAGSSRAPTGPKPAASERLGSASTSADDTKSATRNATATPHTARLARSTRATAGSAARCSSRSPGS